MKYLIKNVQNFSENFWNIYISIILSDNQLWEYQLQDRENLIYFYVYNVFFFI